MRVSKRLPCVAETPRESECIATGVREDDIAPPIGTHKTPGAEGVSKAFYVSRNADGVRPVGQELGSALVVAGFGNGEEAASLGDRRAGLCHLWPPFREQ